MAEEEGNHEKDYRHPITNGYISANDNTSESILSPIINSYQYDDGGSWMFSSHDIPILIGAAAGAIGLIIIFLAAALIWHCCQFALQREKSLDNESERNSVSSRDSNLYINNPINTSIIDEKIVIRENSDQNLKRSISAPIHRDNGALQSNTQTPVIKSNDSNTSDKNEDKHIICEYNDKKSNRIQDSISIGMELNDNKRDNDFDSHRSHIYLTNHILSEEMTALKSRSLPWSQSNKRKTVSIDDETYEEFQTKINFSKKRKNRMRNDSAAAIAMNRSGTDHNTKTHKDTDTLVDNEAIVVYDERTAL